MARLLQIPFLTILVCLMTMGRPVHAQNGSGDPRLTIKSPEEGAVLTPGQTITVTTIVAPGAKLSNYSVVIPGVSYLAAADSGDTAFFASFTVPDINGPVTLIPQAYDSSGASVQGAGVNVTIQPASTSAGLKITPDVVNIKSLGATAQLNVTEQYPNNVVNRTPAASGTLYRSSNAGIASVDANGLVTAEGLGQTVINVRNGTHETNVTVLVEDVEHPAAPENVTDRVTIVPSQITMDKSLYFNQTLLITNNTPLPLLGPLNLVISELPKGTSLMDAGKTVQMLPVGSQYVQIPLTNNMLPPHGQINVAISFVTQRRADLHYRPYIYRSINP